MSQKRNKHNSVDVRNQKSNEGKKISGNSVDLKFKENAIRKLYETFQDDFDIALIASVAHTCQWDIYKATEALLILSGRKKSGKKNKSSKSELKNGTKNKAKSLPGTLKQEKSNEKGLATSNSAHCSTSSLSSGQVWQRHYKSKPQSPGLLTMIPPHSKEIIKLKKSDSGRSTPKSKLTTEMRKANAVVNRIQQLVQNGVKVMILMRGAPGSGKTHLAQVVIGLVTGNELSQHIFSTDDYFIMLGRGNYAYNYNQLPQAHNWNQKRVSEALKRGINPVVVDNTNIQAWEMQPYVAMAVEHGYLIEVLEPVTEWRTKEAELAKKNIHLVPREKIRQMLDRYEPGWTGDKLLKSFGLKYKHCGSSHISQEKRPPTNSVLAQHRQHSVIDAPEKPKRKKNGIKKKERYQVANMVSKDDREKQLGELEKLFAEYGKTISPVSRKKVLDSGVSIPEVVARMRKMQGSVLPLPKTNVPSTIPETDKIIPDNNLIKPVPKYSGARRDSISESAEHDTMSSSNASETSEWETDTDADPPKWKVIKKYFDYGDSGHFVDGEDLMEDYDEEEDDNRTKSEGATGGKSPKGHFTSSQEELSLIDFGTSNTPASYSQDDLSLLNYDGTESPNADDSSSSEEQETQMLTLQESLREVLMDNSRLIAEASEKIECNEKTTQSSELTEVVGVDISDSLLRVMEKRFSNTDYPKINVEPEQKEGGVVSLNESLLEMLVKKYSQEEPEKKVEPSVTERKKSPDLEEVPLPSIPSASTELTDWGASKREKFEDIVNSWVHPALPENKDDTSPKQARPKSTSLGAIRKTGIQRDKSPEELLRSVELSWSSIPFTSSWEDVSKKPPEPEPLNVSKPQRKNIHKMDSSTNTHHADFDLWKKDNDGIVKIAAQSRNINENYKAPINTNQISEILMLDKGSMTLEAEEIEEVENENSLDTLCGMFPGISRDDLRDILEKCNGNILWAIEVLLESPQNLEPLPEHPPGEPEENPPTYNEARAMSEPDYSSLANVVICDGKKTIKRRKDKKGSSSELSLLLKKQIEDSIHINEALYQDKTMFLKKLRHGKISFGDGPIEPIPEPPLEENLGKERNEETEVEEEEDQEEETIPMKIDVEFFKALAKQFGSSDEIESEKQASLVPVINVPFSLAQQIYDCWLENVNKQLEEMETAYDKMVREDELLAAALQEQEFENRQPNLREIMDMEMAMVLYKQDQGNLQGNSRETLAMKLSKQLLFEAYPNLNKEMLLDLFESEGRSFQKTVDILSAQENESPATVVASEFLTEHGNKLISQANLENLKRSTIPSRKPIIIVKPQTRKKETPENKNMVLINPAEYRQKTATLHQQRSECARLAQEAFRKKSYSVASYFSRMAALYQERIRELRRDPFPEMLFEDKSNKLTTKVDLHFLFVPEALQILDLFLNYHIKQLRKKQSEDFLQLNLVTGRGQHSFQGKSKIKNAVKRRLEERNLRFRESNPGMLMVKVHKKNLLSEEL